MTNHNRAIKGIFAAIGMLLMIFDAKMALQSMQEGLTLCIQTIIPSLFPFFVISGIINSCLIGNQSKILHGLGKFCKVPTGAESIIAVGLLAGYPVGAQLVTQAYQAGTLSKSTARRMLGFCSNAGPSFIFGMLAPLFPNSKIPWLLWIIHILSAMIVGFLLPGECNERCNLKVSKSLTITQTLRNAIENIATVCGWVLLFRVIIGFCNRWFLWLLPKEIGILFSGVLELSNGAVLLGNIESLSLRFLFAELMLSFGGICVMMQTASVTKNLELGYYFPGKALQMFISIGMSLITLPLLQENSSNYLTILGIFIVLTPFLVRYFFSVKKVVAIKRKMLYNTGS